MGRPRDGFLWAQVEETVDGWRCKFCKGGFKGSSSRVRIHLSGQGTAISACPVVPEEIRKEALKKDVSEEIRKEASKKVSRKRGRTLPSSSSSTPTSLLQDPSPSSLNDPDSFTEWCKEEHVAALIKLFMCISSSAISDVIKYPYFREFLERTGVSVPSSLIQGGAKFVIGRSLLNIEQEVYHYMLMVKESWRATGCTVMMFNLNRENKGKTFTFGKDRYVCGFYCPKGFIFVEAPRPDIDFKAFKDALKRHSPSMDIYYADLAIRHSKPAEDEDSGNEDDDSGNEDDDSRNEDDDLGNDHVCEFSSDNEGRPNMCSGRWCFRKQLQRISIKVCSNSEWTQGLINKAIKIQQLIQDDGELADECNTLLREKGERLKHKGNINAKGANGLSNFLSIMLLEGLLKDNLPSEYDTGDLDDGEAILCVSNFWDEGRKLERVLNLIFKIPDLMDTLVPTAGYLAMAINTVVDTIFKHCYANAEDACVLLKELASQLKRKNRDSEVHGYLNPLYYLQQILEDPGKVVEKLQCSIYFCQEDEEKLKRELMLYHDVCSKLPREINLHNYHPVKFWEKYGDELPVLQKGAIKALSAPVTCMCNQLKKHLYELQGADDVILRLNLRMMEEFKLLGDDIYKAIDLSELKHWEYSCVCGDDEAYNESEELQEEKERGETEEARETEEQEYTKKQFDPSKLLPGKMTQDQVCRITSCYGDTEVPSQTKICESPVGKEKGRPKGSTKYSTRDRTHLEHKLAHLGKGNDKDKDTNDNMVPTPVPCAKKKQPTTKKKQSTTKRGADLPREDVGVHLGVHFGHEAVDHFMYNHIEEAREVDTDGNCGYRSLSCVVGWDQEQWYRMRELLGTELFINQGIYRPACMFSPLENLIERVKHRASPCSKENWMEVPIVGLAFSTYFQVALVCLSVCQPTLCLPMISAPSRTPPTQIYAIAHVQNGTHFIPVRLSANAPLPSPPPIWKHHHHPSVDGWDLAFHDRMQDYCSLRGHKMCSLE